MCAINMNDEKAVKKAVAISPRGTRAESLLYVTVGTDSVSPLLWAIDCGSLVAAKAILKETGGPGRSKALQERLGSRTSTL